MSSLLVTVILEAFIELLGIEIILQTSFMPCRWTTSCCSKVSSTRFLHLLFASVTVLFYKIAASLLQEMCSIHSGQILGSSIKARHHTDIGQTKGSQDIVVFRDILDFLSQHPQLSILVRMFKTPNCGAVGTIALWCHRCGC